MAIAFFDLDLTVLARNSGSLWVRSELRSGHLSRWQALRATYWITRYHLGFARLEDLFLESIASLTGKPEAEMRERTLGFYQSEIRGLIRPGARAAVDHHRSAGDQLWLLTSSTNYLSEAVAAQLGLEGSLCNRFEIDPGGRFTGKPLGALCFGPGKVVVASRFAQERSVALADCSFYSDSASDVPMLEAVGHPVAVNPDPRLRRIALKRGWPIADWGVPREARRSAA